MSASEVSPGQVHVVILTAIQLEYDAVLKVDAGTWPDSSWEELTPSPTGLSASVRTFQSREGQRLRVVVAKAGDMGTQPATNALWPLVDRLKPTCIAMCGVCAGRPGKTHLGDVIAAERLYLHDTGKQRPGGVQQDVKTYNLRPEWKDRIEKFGFRERFLGQSWLKARPIPIEWQENWLLAKLSQGVADPWNDPERPVACREWSIVTNGLLDSEQIELAADDKPVLTAAGKKRIKRVMFVNGGLPDLSPAGEFLPFKLHVAPIGSGSKVIEDEEYWGFISEHIRSTLGMEMEAAALGAFAHYWQAQSERRLDALVMKGVMDFGNQGRDDHFKEFAARASAECLLAFLRQHFDPDIVPGVDDLLDPGTAESPEAPPPSALLTARYQVVDFERAARTDILSELDRWSDEGPAVAARLLHAEGGAGKTRLAIEWMRQRTAAGWNTGFLVARPTEDWFERLWKTGRPVAVAIDYAESRQGLAPLLERVLRFHQNAGDGGRLRMRILLLARNDGDWWASLTGRDPVLGVWLKATPPKALRPLDTQGTTREELFRQAAKAFAKVKHLPVPGGSPPSLADPLFGRVLYLHMVALAFVNGWEWTANGLMKVILDHEEQFWASRAQTGEIKTSQQQSMARQLVAAATLRGGLATRDDVNAVSERVFGRPPSNDDELLHLLLHRVYQRTGSDVFLPPLEPDLLGEEMVLRVADPELMEQQVPKKWIERVFPQDEHGEAVLKGFTVLGRASVRRPEVARPWIERMLCEPLVQRVPLALQAAKAVRNPQSALGEVLADRMEASGEAEVARALEREDVPQSTVSLRRVGEWMERTLLKALPQSDEEAVLAERARLCNNLGNRLSELGKWEEAWKATREAVEGYRELAERNRDAFLPNLARSLTNLGNRLSELGKWEEALKATREAVEGYRELAERNRDAFLPDLAGSLTNLGNMLSELGKREEAWKATREAVKLGRELAERNRDAFLPDLAGSLNNLGAMFSKPEQREEAWKATREAVELRRELAERNRDAFLPDLAMSLNNLGMMLSEQGQWEEALKATREAVEGYRELAERNRDAFLPNLARSLNNLGIMLSEQGQRKEALDVVMEGVDMIWSFFQALPHVFQDDTQKLLRQAWSLHATFERPLPAVLEERIATFQRLVPLKH